MIVKKILYLERLQRWNAPGWSWWPLADFDAVSKLFHTRTRWPLTDWATPSPSDYCLIITPPTPQKKRNKLTGCMETLLSSISYIWGFPSISHNQWTKAKANRTLLTTRYPPIQAIIHQEAHHHKLFSAEIVLCTLWRVDVPLFCRIKHGYSWLHHGTKIDFESTDTHKPLEDLIWWMASEIAALMSNVAVSILHCCLVFFIFFFSCTTNFLLFSR